MTRLMTAILPKEFNSAQLVLVQAFLGGGALILLAAVAYALTASLAGPMGLIAVFLISAVLLPLISFGFNQISERIEFNQLLPNSWLILTALVVVLWGGALFFPTRWAIILLMTGCILCTTFTHQLQTLATGQIYEDRDSRQTSPRQFVARLAGIVLFGLVVRPYMVIVGNPINLILLSALLIFGLYWVCRRIVDLEPEAFAQRPPSLHQQQRATFGAIVRQPFVRSILLYRFLSALVSSLILFAFITQAGRYFQFLPELLPGFFASFIAFSSLASVGLLIFLFQPLIKRVGLNFGLITSPIAVGILIVVLLIVTPMMPLNAAAVLWLVTLMRAVDMIFAYSASEPTLQAISQILPPIERGRVMSGVNGLSLPLGLAMAAVLLFAMNQFAESSWSYTLMLIAVTCVGWAISGWQTFNGYADTLQERLNRRMLDEVELALDNAETVSQVEKLIGSGNPAMIRLALNLLQSDRHPSYESRLVGLLNFRNENILAEVLGRIEDEKLSHLQTTLEKLFERHHSGRVKGRVLQTLSACNPEDSGDFVQEYLDDTDPDVQFGSLVGLLKYGGLPYSVYAGMRLVEINEREDKASQLFAAKILGAVGASGFFQPLLQQLSHPDEDVRLGALQASTTVINRRLVPAIIENLACNGTRSTAISALLAHADHVIPVARKMLQTEDEHPAEVKARLARVLGEVDRPEAQRILWENLTHADDVVRSAVLNALRQSGFEASTAAEKEKVSEQILAELEQAASLISIQRDIGPGEAMAQLNDALVVEQTIQKDRLFNLLALLYDRHTIWTANEQLTRANGPQKTLADETLEVVLSDRHSQQVSVMIDPSQPAADRLALLDRWVDVDEPQSAVDQLRGLINDEHASAWTRASAIYSAAKANFTSLSVDIEATLGDDLLVHETAKWALGHMKKPDHTASEENEMLTIEKVAILKAASIFKETPGNVLASVAAIVKEIPLEAHETFIKQGDSSSEMFLVVEGEVEAVMNGKSIIKLGQGQTVGELGIFNQETRSADVRTLTPTLLFSIERDALNQLMADRPEIAQGIIGALSRRIREQGQLMAQSA